MKNYISICFCFLLLGKSIYAQNTYAKLRSGNYYPGLILGVDHKKKIISGFFETYKNFNAMTGTAEAICRFYVKGTLDSDAVRIIAYHPDWGKDSILGRFYIYGDSMMILKLQSEPGCWAKVEDDNIVYKGMQFDFEQLVIYLEIGMINQDNVKVYADYGEEKLKPIYIAKKNDIAKVLMRKKGWLKVELLDSKQKKVVGWVRDNCFE